MSFFTQSVDRFCTPTDEYSFGIEVEFYANNDYYKHVRNKFNGVLGIDGACYDNLGEYRSPVFHSRYPFTAFRDSMDFTTEVFKELITQNFLIALCPKIIKVGNMGIHFTIGGKFLVKYFDILDRCKAVQPQLKYRYLDYQKFLHRERGCYGGDFLSKSPVRIKTYGDSYGYDTNGYLNNYQKRDLSDPKTIIEYRFFPSCRVDSLIPYLYYILFGGVFPNNCIQPYYYNGKFYE